MSGSAHFQTYECNLRRILLLDWLHHEQIRRHVETAADRMRRERSGAHERPYWIIASDQLSTCG